MSLIAVTTNTTGYEYDIHSLIKAFYPECDVKVIAESDKLSSDSEYPDITINHEDDKFILMVSSSKGIMANKIGTAGLDKAFKKNALKKLIYETLKEETGKELPWGILTGIRPTKIPMTLMDEGATEEEADSYMKDVYLLSDEKRALAIDIAKREKAILKDLHYSDGYSLYIGIPFCPTTCLYCSFTSYPIAVWKNRVADYLTAVEKEIDFVKNIYKDKKLDTIYIGGGTPSTLEPDEFRRLLSKITDSFDLGSLREFTVEAGRSDSITQDKLKALKEYPVTRISVNPQSMNQKTLDFIGRHHTVEDVKRAFYDARALGFDNINMDIILGLPGEGVPEVSLTMEEIKKLKPDNLTVHSLAIKRASKMAQWIEKNGLSALNNTDETMKIAQNGAYDMGMKPYYLYRQKNMSGNFENVGYSLPDKYGIYNILIMEELQTIVALGAGTVTKRVFEDGRIERCDNVKDVALYIDKIDEMIKRKEDLLGLGQLH